jgi:basic membrane lipoprotein Med (substrate-binding protein (PBP1-ABC) superfamily)
VKRSFVAFEQGARSVNPKVRIVVSYIGNWDDASAGKEQAIAQISRGVDVIFQNADAAGLGVFQAVKESKNALIIGANANQNDIAPNHTLGSVVIDLPRALLLIARDVQKGNFSGKVYSLGLEDSVVTFVENPNMTRAIPRDLIAEVDSTRSQMVTGQFKKKLLPDSAEKADAK